MSLYVHLSEFRVTASAPRTQGTSVPPLKLSVRSARAHARPLESSPATRLDDGSLDFPSWRVRWEERLPTQRSVLHLALIPDNKGRWRQRASCVPVRARASHPVAKAVLELSTLACGTVRRSVRIGPTAPSGVRYDISFDAVVEERANIRLTFKDVAVCSPFPLRSAYLVAAVQGQQGLSVLGSERHVHSAQPEWKKLPTLVLPKWGLAKLAHSVLVLRVHEAQGDNRCVGIIRIPMHDIWAAVLRKQYAAPFQGELQPLYSAGTDAVTPGSIRGFVHIDNVPRTGQMAGGVTTHSGMTGGRPIFCGVPLPYGDRIHGSTEDDGEDLPPHWIQLVDTFGYKYYYNIENSRNSWLRPTEERTVPNHTSGLGALGFERTRNNFYRSLNSGAETWVHPAATRIAPVTYSFDRTTRTAAGTGTESNHSVQQATADSGSETNNNGTISCSSFSLDEPPSVRSLIGPQELSSLLGRSYNSMTPSQSLADNSERATLSEAEPVAQNANAIEEPMALLQATETNESEITAAADNSRLPNRGGSFSEEAAYTTEMKWVRLRLRGHNQVIPGPATQGHTFTAIGNGNTLLKFGGAAAGNVKNNSVFEYNADQMYWRTLKPLGVPPVPRFGHGAVALGSDRSRLLVFGGSCRRGRLNDLHILHTETCAWSAVSAQGEPPGVRSRCGMTATSNGEIALVFGGRSIYRFLGGTYYDQKYVHAFHADRAQWYQIEPRGSVKGPAPRSGCVVEFVNGRQMFVHGGYDDGDEMYSDTFLFDLTSFSWQQLPYPNEPTEPCARESHTSTMVNGSVLMFGGVSERNAYLSDLHMFDPSRLRWVGPPSVSGYSPTGLCGAAMATVNDSQVVVTGGESGFTTSDEAFALDIARYPIADIDSLKERARARDLENMICVVCLDAKVDTMFLWCGHTVCCQSCAKKMESTCPVCRRPCAKIECINDL